MKRLLPALLVAALVAAPLHDAHAQSGRIPRKWLMAGVGALVTGAIATVYAVQFERDIGGCSSVQCVVPVTIALGGFVGYMIGNEMDKLYAVRYSSAPPIDVKGRQLTLAVLPNDVSVHDSTVLVTGEEGIEVVEAGPTLTRLGFRARGLRGIGPVSATPDRNLLLVGSSAGLYRFPLTGEDPGSLAYPGEISALSDDGSRLALGLGPDVQLARMDDSVTALGDPAPEDARVVDLAWQGNDLLWVLTEERLVAYRVRNDALEARGAVTFPSIGRRLAVHDSLAFVAAGSGGLYAVALDPDRPEIRANWSGARFAYDVDALGSTVYLAAGPEGLYLLELGPEGFRPLGLSRGVGFAAAVEAGNGAVYLLDRTGGALRRLEPQTK